MHSYSNSLKFFFTSSFFVSVGPQFTGCDCLWSSAGGRTFLMVNNSSLMKLAQMYEFTTDSPREKRQLVTHIQHDRCI